MTEDEARGFLRDRVPRETFGLLEQFVEMLKDAASQQNLVSAATLPAVWSRHILDSAQLAWHVPIRPPVLDIGTGAGLPGIVLAILSPGDITLAEPRALRVEFLRSVVAALGIADRVVIAPVKVQRLEPRLHTTISARAVAPLPDLLLWAAHCADPDTRWILPRGRSALADVAAAERLWHGRFTIVPSLTDSEAAIVIAEGVRPRKQR